jgi:hypothetical protein
MLKSGYVSNELSRVIPQAAAFFTLLHFLLWENWYSVSSAVMVNNYGNILPSGCF